MALYQEGTTSAHQFHVIGGGWVELGKIMKKNRDDVARARRMHSHDCSTNNGIM